MIKRPAFSLLTYIVLFAATFSAASAAFAQAKPAAPSSVCIADTSGPSSCANVTTSTAGAKKWHPGHYLRSLEAFAYKESSRHDIYDLLKAEPRFQGGLLLVPWGSVETSQGVYDFTQIDRDLAYLKAMGKRMIIEVWWMDYWHPLSSARNLGWVPNYMIDNGCVVASSYAGGNSYTTRLHRPECMDRMIALHKALAARYDNDPNVEQIVITEPCTPYDELASNVPAFVAQFQRLVTEVAKAWPHTTAVFYMNWMYQPGVTAAQAAANGVGIGGPDILPGPPVSGWEDYGSQALRGAGSEYGNVDYRGKIPVSYSYEAIEAGATNMSPAKLLPYALDTLKVTHIAWAVAEWLSTDMNYSTGVLPTLRANNFRINTTYPSMLPK